MPRSLYYGHSKVEGLVAEAHRHVNEVALSSVPTVGFRDRRQYEQKSHNAYGDPPKSEAWLSGDAKSQPPPPSALQDDNSSYLQTPNRPFAGSGYFSEKANSSNLSLPSSLGNQQYAPPYQAQLNQGTVNSQTFPSSHQLGVNEGAVDDFGVHVRSTAPVDAAANRFATFPVKARPPGSSGGYSLQDPPSLGGRNLTASDSSFSASVAEALHEKEDLKVDTLSPWGNRFKSGSELSVNSTARATEGSYNQSSSSWGGRSDHDPPPFEELPPVSVTAPLSQAPAERSSGQLPQPPPGAAPPELVNPWTNSPREGSIQAPSHSRRPSHLSENHDALLAYMTTADGESIYQESPPNTAVLISVPPATATMTSLSAQTKNEEEHRHVRFGAVEDVNKEIEKRVSLEKEQAASTRAVRTSPSLLSEGRHTTTTPDQGIFDLIIIKFSTYTDELYAASI